MTNNSQKELINQFLSFITQNWHSPLALLFLLVVELLILPYFWGHFGEGIGHYEFIALAVFLGGSSLFWALSRKYPKNVQNRIGIVVAVTTESKREYRRLRSDLILRFKEVIRTKSKENIFNIVEIPEYYASKIQDHPSSRRALKKSDAHFIIYGSCKQRLEKGAKHYFMTLDATVVHKPIPKIISDKLAQEFAELFPRRVIFPIENEISGFEITKEWIGLVARYIIGIAAFLSGDFDLSYELDRELRMELKQKDANIGQIKKIKSRIPQRIVESAMALIQQKYFIYRKTKNKEMLYEMKPFLDTLRDIDPNNYQGHLLRGIYLFLVDRNADGAKKEIKRSKNALDNTWRYSEAFLYAYERDLDKAEKSYKKAFKVGVTPDVLFQTEEFINDVLQTEPNQCQLWYCLGMINLFAKGDNILAKEAFQKFLKCGSDADYSAQKKRAMVYLEQVRNRP